MSLHFGSLHIILTCCGFTLFLLFQEEGSASLTLYCNEVGTTFVSRNGGSTWTSVGSTTSFGTAWSAVIDDVDRNTVVRHRCEDTGYIGGFMAKMQYDGVEYSTVPDGLWTVESSTDDDLDLVWTGQADYSYAIMVDSDIAADAQWVWNSVCF